MVMYECMVLYRCMAMYGTVLLYGARDNVTQMYDVIQLYDSMYCRLTVCSACIQRYNDGAHTSRAGEATLAPEPTAELHIDGADGRRVGRAHLKVGVGDVAQRRDGVPAVLLEGSGVLGQLVLGEKGWDIGGHAGWLGRSFVWVASHGCIHTAGL